MERFAFKNFRESCVLCHNSAQIKKHRFVHHHNQSAMVCLRCENALGKKRIQQILDEIPFNPQQLNYKTPERRARLLKNILINPAGSEQGVL